jgi:hypothetical protein
MMSFKEFLRSRPQVLVFYETADTVAAARAEYVIEGGRTMHFDKKWSVRQDRTHHDPTQTHTHIMFRGDDYAILHKNGTPSHNMPADNVPGWVLDRIKKMGLIESKFLVEASVGPLVPAGIIQRADLRSRIHDIIGDLSLRR